MNNVMVLRGGPHDGRVIEIDRPFPSWFGNDEDGWYTRTSKEDHGRRVYRFRPGREAVATSRFGSQQEDNR